jgi:hypothetical protein
MWFGTLHGAPLSGTVVSQNILPPSSCLWKPEPSERVAKITPHDWRGRDPPATAPTQLCLRVGRCFVNFFSGWAPIKWFYIWARSALFRVVFTPVTWGMPFSMLCRVAIERTDVSENILPPCSVLWTIRVLGHTIWSYGDAASDPT